METLLIVEDEKLIRRGIAAMASRSSVSIGEIIECRNGVEAMEILRTRRISTVFTDIRMPKMDGIQLVKEMGTLNYHPDVVVISGYDDFNYAVEMLKQGVTDYILKPVKRDKIEEILVQLDEKQRKGQFQEETELQMLANQLKYLLLSPIQEDWEPEQPYFSIFEDRAYRVILCGPEQKPRVSREQGMLLENLDNQTAVFLIEEFAEEWERTSEIQYYGISSAYTQIADGKKAYEEAKRARTEAFVRCRRKVYFQELQNQRDLGGQGRGEVSPQFIEKFVQRFSAKEKEEAVKELMQLCFEARHGLYPGEGLLVLLNALERQLVEVYQHMIPESRKELKTYPWPLSSNHLEAFLEKMKLWMNSLSDCLEEQFISDQNKRKIKEAVRFIQENYQKDLNMAMVSNHVSMNYSLFSIAFKENMGINFVNYLKEIRIQEAKRLLRETDFKVQEVAQMVGYENDKHFMKVFKSVCGISPSEYRKQNFDRKDSIGYTS